MRTIVIEFIISFAEARQKTLFMIRRRRRRKRSKYDALCFSSFKLEVVLFLLHGLILERDLAAKFEE